MSTNPYYVVDGVGLVVDRVGPVVVRYVHRDKPLSIGHTELGEHKPEEGPSFRGETLLSIQNISWKKKKVV